MTFLRERKTKRAQKKIDAYIEDIHINMGYIMNKNTKKKHYKAQKQPDRQRIH